MRHFDKNVFRAPIMPYDEEIPAHKKLVSLVALAEEHAATVDVSGARTFQQARSLVRKSLDSLGLSDQIEVLVL